MSSDASSPHSTPLERLRAAIKDTRRQYVAGTPEKFPATRLSHFTVLDAESIVEQLEAAQKRLAWYEGLQGDANDADFDSLVREMWETGDTYPAKRPS